MDHMHQDYHIVIFPGSTSRPRRLRIKRRTVMLLLAFSLVAVVLQGGFLVQYAIRSGDLWELEALRSETVQHRQQASALASAQEDLRQQLSSLREANTRLRVMLGLDPPKPSSSPPGLGGREESRVIPSVPSGMAGDIGGEHQPLAAVTTHLQEKLTWLTDEAVNQERHLRELACVVADKKARWAATPSIWPVRGWVSSGFGPRVSPFTGRDAIHSGIDIAAPMSTPVIAPAAGTVAEAGHEKSLGNMIVVSHGYGYQTMYAHLKKIKVKVGQTLKRGDVLGQVGSTGLSTGPHLHYEVEANGRAVDPRKYIID